MAAAGDGCGGGQTSVGDARGSSPGLRIRSRLKTAGFFARGDAGVGRCTRTQDSRPACVIARVGGEARGSRSRVPATPGAKGPGYKGENLLKQIGGRRVVTVRCLTRSRSRTPCFAVDDTENSAPFRGLRILSPGLEPRASPADISTPARTVTPRLMRRPPASHPARTVTTCTAPTAGPASRTHRDHAQPRRPPASHPARTVTTRNRADCRRRIPHAP